MWYRTGLRCSAASKTLNNCGYDHAPVTRGRMRTQYPLPHGHADGPTAITESSEIVLWIINYWSWTLDTQRAIFRHAISVHQVSRALLGTRPAICSSHQELGRNCVRLSRNCVLLTTTAVLQWTSTGAPLPTFHASHFMLPLPPSTRGATTSKRTNKDKRRNSWSW